MPWTELWARFSRLQMREVRSGNPDAKYHAAVARTSANARRMRGAHG